MRIGIVGAGLAGLACARRLSGAGLAVRLFDKGRGPGGRMSTRRLDTPLGQVSFDHGAQYFTARGASFRTQTQRWAQAGVVAPWPAAGADAFVGVPGMNAPLRAMAEALDVTWGRQVTDLMADGLGWRLMTPDGATETFDAVVLALPAEQAAALLKDCEGTLAAAAGASRTAPCWTVMAVFDRPLPIAPDVLRGEGSLGWAARNSAKPGRAPAEAWVIQADAAWSQTRLEDPPETVAQVLLQALSGAADEPLPAPVALQAHRWRYARSAAGVAGALWSPQTRLGCCGDWLLGPRVECAWDSGEALAARILAGAG